MADVENKPESSFPVNRKPDFCCQEQDSAANKAQKLNPPSSSAADSNSRGEEVSGSGVENLSSGKNETESSNSLEKAAGSLPEKDAKVVPGDLASEEKLEGGIGEEEDEDEEEEEEEEEDSIEAEIDRRGKGISREDKGKGKLIEFDSSDDSDDDDEDGGGEYDESDLSDDPLAEVDLDNILPSRTRRRSIQPGVYISGGNNNEDVDDSSDDSDA